MVTERRLQIFMRPWSQAQQKTCEIVLMPDNDAGIYLNRFDWKSKIKNKYTSV